MNMVFRTLRILLIRLMEVLIICYQYTLSPVLHMLAPGSGCRYYPTCSQYAREAIASHGPLRGGWLALRRLMRCHPWGAHGYDPVPQCQDSQSCGCVTEPHPVASSGVTNFRK